MLRSVAVILQEPVAAFEYGVVSEVFGVDRTDEGVPKFDYRVCGIEPGKPLNFTTGAQVIAQYGLEACADVDLVAMVVPPQREGGQKQFVKAPVQDCDRTDSVVSSTGCCAI